MATTNSPSTFEMLQSQEKMSFFAPRTTRSRPVSEATEILDTDYDSDSLDDYPGDSSPHRSVRSLESVTTASTPDDVKTPDSTGLTGFHFHIDENPVSGPLGPHLFRHSKDVHELRSSVEIDLIMEDGPLSATTPLYNAASKLEPHRRDTPLPESTKQKTAQPDLGAVNKSIAELVQAEVANWSPRDVVMWMKSLGFESDLIEKFFVNDISGSILLELQGDDLKELDIQSFGKRHRLLSAIRELRTTATIPTPEPQPAVTEACADATNREATSTPNTTAADVGVSCSSSPVTEDDKSSSRSRDRKQRRRHKRRNGQDIVPEDSVSIVAIEQLLPKLHRCSKGENCRKWQKQQTKLARLAKDLPIESYGGSIICGDPGNPTTAQNMTKSLSPKTPKTPKSEVTPSVVASSDVLGPNQVPNVCLSQDKLNDVRPRDPQENVRNFINFQRLSRLQPANDPSTPPREQFPSPDVGSPDSTKTNANLSENLRHLPKLRIPNSHTSVVGATLSPNYSAQRTITPSILRNKQPFAQQNTLKSPTPCEYVESPSDFYRQDPHYGQSTPMSEMDIPLTAIQMGTDARMCSQSVPPNMRFGNHSHQMADPITRPASTKAENHRRNFSHNVQNLRSLGRLDEGEALGPIETPEDLERTPRAAHCKTPWSPMGSHANDVAHSGWMKKRKTTRLLRHDWADHHFTLRGTQLAMHADEEDSHRNSKALEYIDVDDYAVACSSLPSNSKLTAAFKKTVLKRSDNINGEAAFAFSLIPSPSSGSSGSERKSFFTSGPKAHHFAVLTRDERIDWMRELMLAKALRRGRESGASVNVNGTSF